MFGKKPNSNLPNPTREPSQPEAAGLHDTPAPPIPPSDAASRADRIRETPLLTLGSGDKWCVRDAIEGTQIFGATGSGKTSGSGATLARAFLTPREHFAGFGGLVLTAKPDEIDNWREYLGAAGRPASDLVEVRPEPGGCFNFLEYELHRSNKAGGELTMNLVSLFLSALSPGESAVSGIDPYWNEALRELLTHAIDLAILSTYDPRSKRSFLTLELLFDIVRSAPQSPADTQARVWLQRTCARAIREAEQRQHVYPRERQRDLKQTVQYWMYDFPRVSDRTRSIVVSSFTAKAAGLLRSPLRELFSEGGQRADFEPERSLEGKVIIVNLPVKVYGEVGRFAQVLYKTVWQRAIERRSDMQQLFPNGEANPSYDPDWRPVFLWADESQYFITKEDMLYQQTARSRYAATVYLTQNLPNYYAVLDGSKGTAATDSLLGNLQTKIFHANGDPATNEWAERVFGKQWKDIDSETVNRGGGYRPGQGHGDSSLSSSTVPQLVPVLEASRFTTLLKGGVAEKPEESLQVQAYIFQAGRRWAGRRLAGAAPNACFHTFIQERSDGPRP